MVIYKVMVWPKWTMTLHWEIAWEMCFKCPCGIEVVSEQWIDISEFQIDPNLGFKSKLHCVLSAEFHSESCRDCTVSELKSPYRACFV